jgi:hypothetical protein
VPEVVVNWYQEQRRGLKIPAVKGPGLYAIGIGFLVAMMYIFTLAMTFVTLIFNKLVGNRVIRVFLFMGLLLIVLYTLYYLYYRPDKDTAYLAAAQQDIKSLFEGFQNAEPSLDSNVAEQPLLNLQPLAMKQVAYIGPKVSGGSFDLDVGLREPLKTGVRFYTLQIDYLDSKKDPKKFPPRGEPAIVYKDDKGYLISANGLRLKDVAQKFADYAFSEESVGADYPLILYLHFTRTPDPVKTPEEYVNFLSATAAALEPLFPNHLGATAAASYVRQQGEADLLRTPVRDLSKKVIYMSNVDTSLFRRAAVLGMNPFESKYDLDYLVNVRVYAETAADILGPTGIAASKSANAVLVSLRRILSLKEPEMKAFAEMSKTRFVIAMGSQAENPTKKRMDTAYTTLGVNVIPILPFDAKRDELKGILKLWSNGKFLRTRPPALQGAIAVAAQ